MGRKHPTHHPLPILSKREGWSTTSINSSTLCFSLYKNGPPKLKSSIARKVLHLANPPTNGWILTVDHCIPPPHKVTGDPNSQMLQRSAKCSSNRMRNCQADATQLLHAGRSRALVLRVLLIPAGGHGFPGAELAESFRDPDSFARLGFGHRCIGGGTALALIVLRLREFERAEEQRAKVDFAVVEVRTIEVAECFGD